MKFSYNWISELIGGLTVPAGDIGRFITLKTAECEGVEPYGQALSEVRLAKVLEAAPIEGTHLTLTRTATGSGGRQVVCGAPNCRAGLITAHWPLGRKTVRGVESDGMLASGAELGINKDHDGILEFAEGQPGDPLPGLIPDTIVEIDNKSLTHRPDLWGHFGMAREVAAISGRPLLDPVQMDLLPDGPPPVSIDIRDFQLCPRYSALVFENVTVMPSPLWLQYRLMSIGLNPINNIVDVTNWIMAELAQPMHAFDLDKIPGSTVIVRPAAEGEACEALNGVTYTLDPSNLVIASQDGPIAIAGVIGGGPSAIGPSTTRILFESANFHAASVRKTSSKLKLRTDASMRFEKAQDPVNTTRALARAIALLRLVSPGIRLAGGLADSWKQAPAPEPIHFTHDWMQWKLGRQISADEVASILESLAFGVTRDGERFTVTVPSWRATKDISIKEDLVEEVGRIIGYGSITPVAPEVPTRVPPQEPERAYHRRVRAALTAIGFTEVYNYSFISVAQAERFGLPAAGHLRVLNPIAAGQELLRSSLLPNVLKNIEQNRLTSSSFRFFEIGREIHRRQGSLPDEIPACALVLYEKEGDGRAGLNELKRAVDGLAPGFSVTPAEARHYEHPHRAGTLHWRGVEIGRLFEFHPSFVELGRAQVAYLNLATLLAHAPGVAKYTPLRRFPVSDFDITVPVEPRTLAAEVIARVDPAAVPNLLNIAYLYEYESKGAKTMTLRFTLGAPDRTLESAEIQAAQEIVRAALR